MRRELSPERRARSDKALARYYANREAVLARMAEKARDPDWLERKRAQQCERRRRLGMKPAVRLTAEERRRRSQARVLRVSVPPWPTWSGWRPAAGEWMAGWERAASHRGRPRKYADPAAQRAAELERQREHNRLYRQRKKASGEWACTSCGAPTSGGDRCRACAVGGRWERRLICAGCGGRKSVVHAPRCWECRTAENAVLAARSEFRKAMRAAAKGPRPRARTPEETREAQRAWRAAHPGYQRQKSREWNARNPEKVKARKKVRRKTTVEYLMKAQRGRCAYCRDRLGADFHVDHIIPRAAGGSNRRSNLQLACADCNIAKGAKDPVVFAQSLGRLI